MDRKSIIILVVSLLFLAAWWPITNKIFPPVPARTNTVATVTNPLPEGSNAAPTLSTLDTNVVASIVTNLPSREEQTITLENDDALYIFTSIGGGVKSV